jgi:PPK2 family polyphosphate:nucleotide phosphotransferase
VKYRKEFIVQQGKKFRLESVDPDFTDSSVSAIAARAEIETYLRKLSKMQILLWAEKKRSILIVLQAPDAGGKDGTIRHVFGAFNPQSATVTSFKQPTPAEKAHDFLWRIHPHAPGTGEIAIFNRSHYEDVLVPRVHGEIDRKIWEKRYSSIRSFEAELADRGTHILKFFLHISKEEQLARFAKRIEDPERNWKIDESDYTERAFWDDYIAANDNAINATSTRDAPWYVIPANHKWFRNLAVSRIIADTMEDMDMSYPPPSVDLAEIRRKYHEAARQLDREGRDK